MKARLKLVGFPALVARLGADEIDVELSRPVLGELLEWLQRAHGDAAGTRVLDRDGRVDESVQILLNGGQWVPRGRLDLALEDGDRVTLLVLVAGG